MSIEIVPIFGCHTSTGRSDKDGYTFNGSTRAHIVAWERVHGRVPDGMVLDHLCRNRKCCAPHHLEPVTQSANELRKSWGHRSRRKTCPKGHEMRLNKILTPHGGLVCRQCNRDAGGTSE